MNGFRIVACAFAAFVFAGVMATRLGIPHDREASTSLILFVGACAALLALSLRKGEW